MKIISLIIFTLIIFTLLTITIKMKVLDYMRFSLKHLGVINVMILEFLVMMNGQILM